MKICCICGTEFEQTRKRQPRCPPCKRQYDNEYHARRTKEQLNNKRESQRLRRQSNARFIFDYLSTKSCVLCGESDPVVLEFDHISQEDKLKCISNMVHYSLVRIKEEISKCRVLCCNCHRRHTAKQLGWYSYL